MYNFKFIIIKALAFQNEAAAALLAATATPKNLHVTEEDEEQETEMTNGENGENGDVSRDLDTDENIKDPVEERRTLAERNERLHDQLKVSQNFMFSPIFMIKLKSLR